MPFLNPITISHTFVISAASQGCLWESQGLGFFPTVAAAIHPFSVPAEAKGPDVPPLGTGCALRMLPGFQAEAQGAENTLEASTTFQSRSHGDNQVRASALPEPPVGFRGDRLKEISKNVDDQSINQIFLLGGPTDLPYTPNIAADLYSFVRLCENISTLRT